MAHSIGAPRPPRRWVRRVLIGLNIFLAVCVVAVATSYIYVKKRIGEIETVHIPHGVLVEDSPGEPMNVLLVGSDSRARIDSKTEGVKFGTKGEIGGQRSDTIMILHVNPASKQAAILSIPRDLWVKIDGTNGNQRINTAFEISPERLINTIRKSLGIEINHYIDVDFVGFREIVKAVGGVKVYFPAPARDRLSGLEVPRAGCNKLTGDQALAYVRARHYQTYESGRWRTDGTSDIGRIQRQQDFIRRTIRASIGRGIRNPIILNRLVAKGVQNVTIDETLSSKDIGKLGLKFKSLSPEAVEMLTLPTDAATIGGAAVLRLRTEEAQQIIDRFNGVTGEDDQAPVSVIPGEVRVDVLNGSGIGGHAGTIAVGLQTYGFGIGGTGDADTFNYAHSVIKYGPGQRDKARLVKTYLAGRADIESDPTLQGTDVVVITGADLRGIRKPNTTGSTTTSSPPVSAKPKGAVGQPAC